MAKLIFLGTAGYIPSKHRDNTSLVFIDDSGEGFLIDCVGSVIHKLLKAKVNYKELNHILLTHNHIDHIYGLVSLFHTQLGIRKKINIYGSIETLTFTKKIFETHNLNDPERFPKPVYNEVKVNKPFFKSSNVEISAFGVKHISSSVGFKFIIKPSRISWIYTSDTAYNETLIDTIKNTDYLIHECSAPSYYPYNKQMHTSALELGRLAEKSKVKVLIPINFSTELNYDLNEILIELNQNFTGKIIIPSDLDVLEI